MLHPGQWSGQQDLSLERYGQILFWCSYITHIDNFFCFNNSGQNANTEERKAAMKVAEQFVKDKNYPKNTQVSDLDPAC